MKYKFLDDLTSDVLFEAYGRDLKELLENSAEALFSVICDIGKVGDERRVRVAAEGDDEESLLYNWLAELLTRSEIEGIYLKRFDIVDIGMNGKLHVEAECYGEDASVEKGGTYVKAVTYYRFEVEKTEKGYRATVSLDI